MGLAPILRKNGFKPFKINHVDEDHGDCCQRCGTDLKVGDMVYVTKGHEVNGEWEQDMVCDFCRHSQAKRYYYGCKHESLWAIWVAIKCKMARPRSFNRRERKIIRTKFLSR